MYVDGTVLLASVHGALRCILGVFFLTGCHVLHGAVAAPVLWGHIMGKYYHVRIVGMALAGTLLIGVFACNKVAVPSMNVGRAVIRLTPYGFLLWQCLSCHL